MSFIEHQANVVYLREIFNEQHAAIILEQKRAEQPNFDTIVLHNVGVKIMKDAFERFTEHPILKAQLYYNWNEIMLMPKLVCYDKNTWKTLQQLSNWNREWSLVFRNCYSLRQLHAEIVCSFADGEFVKALLEGVAALPNVKQVSISLKSKNEKAGEMLQAFKKAQIFPVFNYKFSKYSD